VRVIDEEGKQVGVLSRDEALAKAKILGVDLVEVAAKARPPVCRLMDFKKFKYLESKKEKEQKKKSKDLELKELKLTPFMGEHDLKVRVKRARELLTEGNRLKLWVQFRGRQFTKKDFGRKVLAKICEELKDLAKTEQTPRMIGPKMVCFLIPLKKGEKDDKKETKNKNSSSKKIQNNSNG